MSRVIKALYKIAAQFTDLPQQNVAPAVSTLAPHIKQWEGTRNFKNGIHQPYWDKTGGLWSIGYGFADPALVEQYRSTGMSDKAANVYLNRRLNAEHQYFGRYPNYKKLNPNQQAALISFRYNTGAGNFYKSDARRYLESGDLNKIPQSIAMHNSVHQYDPTYTKDTPGVKVDSKGRYYTPKVVKGLDNRRKAEVSLWNTPWQPKQPVPEPQLAEEDFAAAEAARVKKPVQEPEIPGITNGRP